MFTFFILCEKVRGSHHASTSPPVRAAQGEEGPARRMVTMPGNANGFATLGALL